VRSVSLRCRTSWRRAADTWLLALAALAAWRASRSSRSIGTAGAECTTRTGDGVLLHVEVDGVQDAELTVVFVHGYGASLGEWRCQRAALAPHARLVLFDQRGHGRSGWAHPRQSTVGQLGEDLRAVVRDHATDRPVVLVSHSLGGMAVLALVAQHPELLRSTVQGVALLSTSTGRLTGPSALLVRLLRRTRAAAPLVWSLWAAAPVIDRLSPFTTDAGRALLRRRLFSTPDADPGDVQAALQDFAGTPVSVLLALAPSMLHYRHADVVSRLRPLPVLVLAGTLDRTIPVAHSRRLFDELRGCGRSCWSSAPATWSTSPTPARCRTPCSDCSTMSEPPTSAEQR
jgi:pimeloyl-ACP methyl ester carboxylesterase